MKKNISSSLIMLALTVWSTRAVAKVFNFANLNVASYLKAYGGNSTVHNDAFIHGAGGYDSVTVKEGAIYSFAGEFGFSFGTGGVTTRIGIEVARPQKLSDYEAKDSSDQILYTLTSDVAAYSPAITFEWQLTKQGSSKSYIFTGGGYSYISLINNFDLTAAGTTAFGKSDFIEDAKAQAVFGTIGMGYEMLMVDNVTFSMELGYRHLEARRFLLRGTSDAISDSYVEGDVLKNTDGTDRRLILSHPFIGILFKFYI